MPPNIVRHADRLIRHNHRRINKNPQPYQKEDSTINIVPTLSASLEAKSIVQFLQTFQEQNKNLSFDQVAILYRTNAQSLPIQVEFILQNIPYQVRDEDNILENESLRKLLGALRAKIARQENRRIEPEDQLLTLQAYFRYMYPQVRSQLRQRAQSVDLLAMENRELLCDIIEKARQSQFMNAFESLVRAETLDESVEILRRRFKGLGRMNRRPRRIARAETAGTSDSSYPALEVIPPIPQPSPTLVEARVIEKSPPVCMARGELDVSEEPSLAAPETTPLIPLPRPILITATEKALNVAGALRKRWGSKRGRN